MGYTFDHYEKYDPNFGNDLENSTKYVWVAAKLLSNMGYNVTVKCTKLRPSVEEMAEYSDDGDLEINQRVEVKHRPKLTFTCQDDFPYETVIVDVAHTWDSAKPKPMGYFIFNADASAYLVVKGDTSKDWIKVKKYDKAKNREREFYECHKSLCKFYKTEATVQTF